MSDGWGYYRGNPEDLVGADVDLDRWRRLIVGPRPDWHDQAACLGMDTAIFFPRKGESAKPALEICGGCPSRRPCLDAALADPQLDHGIRGGMSAEARKAHRRLDQTRARRTRRA